MAEACDSPGSACGATARSIPKHSHNRGPGTQCAWTCHEEQLFKKHTYNHGPGMQRHVRVPDAACRATSHSIQKHSHNQGPSVQVHADKGCRATAHCIQMHSRNMAQVCNCTWKGRVKQKALSQSWPTHASAPGMACRATLHSIRKHPRNHGPGTRVHLGPGMQASAPGHGA